MTDEEIQKILVKPKSTGGFGLLMRSSATDKEGEKYYNELLLGKFFKMDEKRLLEEVKNGSLIIGFAYFALCERYFKKYSRQLSGNVDDCFGKYFSSKIMALGGKYNTLSSDKLIKETMDLEDSFRKTLTRKGLDIICRKSSEEDAQRIRYNFKSGFTGSSFDEIVYLKKFGDWHDIPYIAKAEGGRLERSTLLGLSVDDDWYRLISEAIYKIGKYRFEELLAVDMPEKVSVELIRISSKSNYSQLSDDAIFKMLYNDKINIRKAFSLKCIQSFKKSKLKSILDEYVGSDNYRYYNVIHWLDFGVSMPNIAVRQMVKLGE